MIDDLGHVASTQGKANPDSTCPSREGGDSGEVGCFRYLGYKEMQAMHLALGLPASTATQTLD